MEENRPLLKYPFYNQSIIVEISDNRVAARDLVLPDVLIMIGVDLFDVDNSMSEVWKFPKKKKYVWLPNPNKLIETKLTITSIVQL